jgi:uncharacterized DUF497 family protein
MQFEWDQSKSASNLQKHGITFTAATQVFDDPNRRYSDSTREGDGERRALVIGQISDGRLFTVVFTMRNDITRIISARRSRDAERRTYRQGSAPR